MKEARFALIGVVLGALICWLSSYSVSIVPASVDGAWDCYHSTATQQYGETGWECINRANRDERATSLKTEMYPMP